MKKSRKASVKRRYSKTAVAAHKRRIRRARPVHKKILLHPITVFFWLCVGVMLAFLTFKTSADNVVVTASVPGTPPASPAIITYPTDGAVFSSTPITIRGTCPSDTYVNLFRNNVFSGTDICQADNTFSIQTDLFAGGNELQVQDYNFGDTPGPSSAPITVYFSKPVPPPAPSSGGQPVATINQPVPLVVTSNFIFKGYYVGTQFSWEIEVKGGTPPYVINVDWGDGQKTNYSLSADPTFLIKHTYNKAGAFHGSYVIQITVTDSAGSIAHLQLIAIINNPGSFAGATTTPTTPTIINNWLWLVWPAWIIVILMIISFWLGERQKIYEYIRSRHYRPRRV